MLKSQFKKIITIFIVIIALGFNAHVILAQEGQPCGGDLVRGVPKDGIPAIDDPKFLTVDVSHSTLFTSGYRFGFEP